MKTIWILNIWKQKFDACHFIFFRFDTNRQNYEPRTHIKQGIYRMYFIVNNVIFTLRLFLRYEYILQPLFQFLLIHLLPLNNALHIWSGKLKSNWRAVTLTFNTWMVVLFDFLGVVVCLRGAMGEAVRRIIRGELEGDRWGLWLGLVVARLTPPGTDHKPMLT